MNFQGPGRLSLSGVRDFGLAFVLDVTFLRARLAVVVKLKLLVAPLLLIFAMCFALGAQARAMDDAGSDSDDIVSVGAADLVFTRAERLSLEPPAVRIQALPPPIESNSGRRVIADLFRPPITA
ncbi:MAG TPA: hypothetical protein VH328_13830 [Burkholderiaceae bacterium]|nr:hypothetical protein [Burkholderiaceae bacterium]